MSEEDAVHLTPNELHEVGCGNMLVQRANAHLNSCKICQERVEYSPMFNTELFGMALDELGAQREQTHATRVLPGVCIALGIMLTLSLYINYSLNHESETRAAALDRVMLANQKLKGEMVELKTTICW